MKWIQPISRECSLHNQSLSKEGGGGGGVDTLDFTFSNLQQNAIFLSGNFQFFLHVFEGVHCLPVPLLQFLSESTEFVSRFWKVQGEMELCMNI